MATEQQDPLKELKKRVMRDVTAVVDKAFEDFMSLEQLPRYPHTFKFNPSVSKDSGPFRSMTSRLLEKLHAEKGMEYRIVEGKPGEVVAVEFSAQTDADREAVERYAKWVAKTSEPPPRQGRGGMEGTSTLSPTKLRILDRAQQQARWTDLLNHTGVTPKALLDHINWLKSKGLIKKDETTGLYSITDKGRNALKAGSQLLERVRVLEWADKHLEEVKRLMANRDEVVAP